MDTQKKRSRRPLSNATSTIFSCHTFACVLQTGGLFHSSGEHRVPYDDITLFIAILPVYQFTSRPERAAVPFVLSVAFAHKMHTHHHHMSLFGVCSVSVCVRLK